MKTTKTLYTLHLILMVVALGATTHCGSDDSPPVNMDGTVAVYARPSLLTVVGDTLVTGLALLSFEFNGATRGQVALVDVETAEVEAFPLPEHSRNCGTVRSVPGGDDLVMVACTGFSRPFGDEVRVRATSGVYVLRIDDGQAEIVRSWEPRGDEARPLSVVNVTPLSDRRFLGVDYGSFGVSGDRAFIVDMESGSSTLLLEANSAFSIGISAYDPSSGLLIVPDTSAEAGGLRRFQRMDERFILDEIVTFADGPLPAARVYLLPIAAGSPRYAVVRSDFESTAIATLNNDGVVLNPAVLSSGSQTPGLVAPLSGDVVIANATRNTAGILNIVDRLGTDVITRFDLSTETVIGQIRVAPGDFSTNPQDVAIVDDRAWVSRFSVNLDTNAPQADQGNDVVEFDLNTLELTGRRSGLDSFTTLTSTLTDSNGA